MLLAPVITFRGGCAKAISFYRRVFPAVEADITTFGERAAELGPLVGEAHEGLVFRAELTFTGGGGAAHLVLGDSPTLLFTDPAEWSGGAADNLIFEYACAGEEQIRAIYTGLLEGGGKANGPLAPKPGFVLFGSVIDAFGLCWNLVLREG